MTEKLFRQMILAWWGLGILMFIVSYFTINYLPVELLLYYEKVVTAEPTAWDWFTFTISAVILLLAIIASIGVYRFEKWGRSLFLWVNIISCLITPAYGVSIMSGWSLSMCFFILILTGGILFSMYMEPIKSSFELSNRSE